MPILVDQRAVDATEIRRAVAVVPGIRGVPRVRSRTSASGALFSEVTITCEGTLTVAQAHDLADAAERAVREALGDSDVTVHIEPA